VRVPAPAMRVLSRDDREGAIRLRVENADDLWHLHNLVEPGDLVRASTYRREEAKADKIRPERMEKVRVTLGIRVAGTEFHDFADRLRIFGTIVEGPQDLGHHHTLNLTVGDDITIVKVWRPLQLRRVDEAVEAAQKPMVAFVAIDDEEALVAQLRQYGVRELATVRAPHHGKMYPTRDGRDVYFREVLEALRHADLGEALVVLGPGFTREELAKYLGERAADLAARVRVFGTSQGGMAGINEAMKAGLGAKVFEETRVGIESRAVERLLEAIARGTPCAYGPEVHAAVAAGAVETLLVTDEAVRDRGVEALAREAEGARGKVLVVSSRHEAGKKLAGLGGLGAMLRFPIR